LRFIIFLIRCQYSRHCWAG